ncbi:major facilitator superfamily domain-containing protein [Elsinoe ampelina]|uniref:Major facilitator superfamily domain-containing protein n=1 Tax=Elsinoe ampelina TaxID=302913 RepID=A0A6A6FXQ1_9PEZI|nr:major facilitator superfamily domain-containing protein [Elsinoe ampelina]
MSHSSSDPEAVPKEPSLHSKEGHGASRKNDTDIQSRNVISFPDGDPENPYNWSKAKKIYIVILGVVLVTNSTIGSSIASGTPVQVSEYFQNDNQYQLVLPISIYLVGYVLGPLAFGPLSENYGRKWVMIATFAIFTLFTLACALAPTFAAYITFRFLAGVGASAPISVVGGIYADIYPDPVTRGRAMSIFMAATTWGPLIGPIASGFASPALGWRWVYWLALIFAGASWPLLLFSPETYGPVILKRRAAALRARTGDERIVAPMDLEPRTVANLLTVVLTRPVRMFIFEALVLCSCLYLAFAYAVFYMFFQAYPIIYPQIYGFNYGQTGLAFLPVGVGSIVACGIYLYWDVLLQRAKDRDAPWSKVEEYRRLPLACIGGPLFVISLFWLGWSAREDVHWIVPVLSALPFGTGFLLLFMALLNYLVDAYDVFAASATAAAACSRSLFGAVLPFAARPMYEALGVQWACTLLGGLSLALCVIPFVFLRYGGWLRERSKFCRELENDRVIEDLSDVHKVQPKVYLHVYTVPVSNCTP